MRQIDQFGYDALMQLRKIAKQLHRLDEIACNNGLTESQEKREAKLVVQADIIAKNFDLRAFHQSDPRGCSLYLLTYEQNMEAHSNYSSGVAIW